MLVEEFPAAAAAIQPGYAGLLEEKQPCGTAVFLIATPLQALNAIEARRHFKLAAEQCQLVWFHSASEANDRQTGDMLERADWARIRTISHDGGSFRSWKRRFDEVNAVARSMERTGRLFMGDYAFDLMRHFAHAVDCRKVVVLDDGNSTLLMNRSRRDPNIPYHFMPHSFGERVKHLIKTRTCGMNRSLFDELTFFTVYDLDGDHRTTIVPNTYQHLRGRLRLASRSDETFLLGDALPDKNLMSEDAYFGYLERALDHLEQSSVVYMAHRFEKAAKLGKIESRFGIAVRQSTMPIECRLCLAASVPKLIAGFVTSALDTCRILCGDQIGIKSFYIDPADCVPAIRGAVEEFYGHYESYTSENFELIRVY